MTLSLTRRKLVVVAIAATTAFFGSRNAPAEDNDPVTIAIDKFQFTPDQVHLKPGDVVIWKNHDLVPHTATATDGSWDSGTIESGGSWRMVVTEAMMGDYYCVFHPTMLAKLHIQSE